MKKTIKLILIFGLSLVSLFSYAEFNPRLLIDSDPDMEVVCPLHELKKQPNQTQIKAIATQHSEWISTYKLDNPITWENLTATQIKEILADPRRADFSQTDLSGIQFTDLHLKGANFKGARLNNASLNQVDLSFSDLTCASFTAAQINQSKFNHAHMIKTRMGQATVKQSEFKMANLTHADLEAANLSENSFHRAKLVSAHLVRGQFKSSDLTDADFTLAKVDFANFSHSIWELESGTLPEAHSAARMNNLSALSYLDSPGALIELRESFATAGMDTAQREVTYALNKTKNEQQANEGIQGSLTAGFNFLFFDLTSEYGRSPARPLKIIFALIFIFALPYYLAIRRADHNAIWRVWNPERIHQFQGGAPEKIAETGIRALLFALYFSTMSAFRLGWRDINVGDWLSNIQHHEYNLQSTGWVRSLSGIQSVISMYLLALWILTFFTTPFG